MPGTLDEQNLRPRHDVVPGTLCARHRNEIVLETRNFITSLYVWPVKQKTSAVNHEKVPIIGAKFVENPPIVGKKLYFF